MADIIIFECPTLCKFCPIISASLFTFNYDLIILYLSLYISRNKISFTSLNRQTFMSLNRHTFTFLDRYDSCPQIDIHQCPQTDRHSFMYLDRHNLCPYTDIHSRIQIYSYPCTDFGTIYIYVLDKIKELEADLELINLTFVVKGVSEIFPGVFLI